MFTVAAWIQRRQLPPCFGSGTGCSTCNKYIQNSLFTGALIEKWKQIVTHLKATTTYFVKVNWSTWRSPSHNISTLITVQKRLDIHFGHKVEVSLWNEMLPVSHHSFYTAYKMMASTQSLISHKNYVVQLPTGKFTGF